MKIAITTWGNRVSPVFDSARTLLIADIIDQTVQDHSYAEFTPGNLIALMAQLRQQKVSTLICGAISTRPANAIVDGKIRLISFVSGNAMEILQVFARKNSLDPTFMMPGCDLPLPEQ